MEASKPHRVTQYSMYVVQTITALLDQSDKYWTIDELANACGLKPTHNFRQQLNRLAEGHFIQKHFKQNADKRITALYGRKGIVAP